jgi:hypothetical protein
VNDFDTEMAFIRSLSVHGLTFAGEMSQEDKRERIRIAICSQNLENAKFNHGETYGQAYQRCYGRPVEMRRMPRNAHQPAILEPAAEEDEDL